MNWLKHIIEKRRSPKGMCAVCGMLYEQIAKSEPIHDGMEEAIADGEDANLLLARAAEWMDISKRLNHRDATVLRYVAAFLLATAAKVDDEERVRLESTRSR